MDADWVLSRQHQIRIHQDHSLVSESGAMCDTRIGEVLMSAGQGGVMRASDRDRQLVQARLSDAYAEGRLTREEWDQRSDAAIRAVTYADLGPLIADLPTPVSARPVPAVRQPSAPPAHLAAGQQTNRLAIAALVCGVGLFVFPPTGVAAIVLGHKARAQIRRTGEHGRGMATAGLVLGYWLVLSVAIGVLIAVAAHP
jgi:Domain of unknown function (DUF1707)/Domain of unknown function (DUF4190)